jgi:hypothetical protein
VGDGSIVHFSDGINDIFQKLDSLFDLDSFDNVEIVEESASVHELKNEIEAVLLLKNSKKFDYFGVIESTMQFDFLDELVNDVILFQFLLEHLLDGNKEACLLMKGEINLPEFALPNQPAQLKSIDYFR